MNEGPSGTDVASEVLEFVSDAERLDAMTPNEVLKSALASKLLWDAHAASSPVWTKNRLKLIKEWGIRHGHAVAANELYDRYQEHVAALEEFLRWSCEESALETDLADALRERRIQLRKWTTAMIHCGRRFATNLVATGGGGNMTDGGADDPDTQRKQRGLDLWNGNKGWGDVALALDGTADTQNAVREEIKRFAKGTQQAIRKGRPGKKRRANLNE